MVEALILHPLVVMVEVLVLVVEKVRKLTTLLVQVFHLWENQKDKVELLSGNLASLNQFGLQEGRPLLEYDFQRTRTTREVGQVLKDPPPTSTKEEVFIL